MKDHLLELRKQAKLFARDQLGGRKLKRALTKPFQKKVQEIRLRPQGMSYWYEENFWEPTVQLALRDLCRPGMVVFDVGANTAGLTTVMSRMVGPKGIVCAFEASPRIIDRCQHNLVVNGCTNVQLFHSAVYSRSYEYVSIYPGDHLNDDIFGNIKGSLPIGDVQTIALDDFIDDTGLIPSLVKMDIEGAEYDALQGMKKLLSKTKPQLILEVASTDVKILEFLKDFGYSAIDLSSYEEVIVADTTVETRNYLFIHSDHLQTSIYNPAFLKRSPIGDTTASQFITTKEWEGLSSRLKTPISLNTGRYLFDMDFTAKGKNNDMICGVSIDGRHELRYQANSETLASSYKKWIIDIPRTAKVDLFFTFLRDTSDSTFRVNGGRIFKFDQFDRFPRRLYR